MENLIKRNNFSPEDKKILFKIDKHIKELEKKVEQGGGGGVTENVKEYNFHIPVDNIPLVNSLTDYEDYVNYYDDYVPFDSAYLIIEPLNINFEQGSIINVYLNDKFYRKCRMINVDEDGQLMKAIVSAEYYDLMITEKDVINNDKFKVPDGVDTSMEQMMSNIIYAEISTSAFSTCMLVLTQYVDIRVDFSPDAEELQHNINAFNILKNNNNTIVTLCDEYCWKTNIHNFDHNLLIKILETSNEGIRFRVPISETEHYEYTLLPTGEIDRNTAEQYIYDNETLYNRIQSIDDSIVQSLNTPI